VSKADALWADVLSRLMTTLNPNDVQIWFRDAVPSWPDPNHLHVVLPNRYYVDWVEENYAKRLTRAATEAAGFDVTVVLECPDADIAAEFAPPDADPQPPPAETSGGRRRHNPMGGQTFENFVVGECNRMAHAAASAVAETPANAYNPLFIYGATGLGKTHLMRAVGNAIANRDPEAIVVYVTLEDFMNDMISAIHKKRMDAFREHYRRDCSVLLVDDVQFLSGKQRTQEEFFFTFNALLNSSRQIVLTSDLPPDQIEGLEPRLRTRFEGGLLADMQAPDEETFIAILHRKAEDLHITLPTEVAARIASVLKGDIREAEGVINRLHFRTTVKRQPVTTELAMDALPQLFHQPRPAITVTMILETVARFHNLTTADLLGPARSRNLSRPRHLAMYLARKHTQLSFPELGREFGNRDHSTIQHGVKKTEAALEEDRNLAHEVRLIENALKVPPR
jgi:chromosomal replication initiator protein